MYGSEEKQNTPKPVLGDGEGVARINRFTFH